jgi:hypothetical protein
VLPPPPPIEVVPPAAAPLSDSAGVLPPAAPGIEAVTASAAAPITNAAAVAAPPVPPVPVVPIGGLGGVPAPVGVVPSIPVASAVPDIGLPLPATLPIPTDLVCEGTAWAAHRGPGNHLGSATAVDRRDHW